MTPESRNSGTRRGQTLFDGPINTFPQQRMLGGTNRQEVDFMNLLLFLKKKA
jgi:hypothetical protein